MARLGLLSRSSVAALLVSCSDGTVTIEGAQIELEIVPAQLDFGPTPVGTPAERAARVRVSADVLAGLTIEPDSALDPAFTFAVSTDGPSAGALVTVTYLPTAREPSRSALLFRRGGVTLARLPLTGQGTDDLVRASPASLSFDEVALGDTRALPLRMVNRTRDTLVAQLGLEPGLALCDSAASTPFCLALARPLDDGMRVPLAPEEALELEVRFTPRQAAQRERSALHVTPCVGCVPVVVDLDGVGIAEAVTCAPAQLVFDETALGTCAASSVSCTNRSSVPRTIAGWRASGEGFVVSPPVAPVVLEGAGSHSIEVRYCPTTEGLHGGTLTIAGESEAERYVVQLAGRGGGGVLEAQPAALEFGEVSLIAPARRAMTVRNTGSQPLTLAAFRMDRGAESAFVARASPTVLAPRQAMEVIVELQPTAVGPVTDTLRIVASEASQREVAVPLRGIGVEAAPCSYAVAPRLLDFGQVERGRTQRRAVEVRNVGEVECLLTGVRMDDATRAAELSLVGGERNERIAPGAAAVVAVDFAPGPAGRYPGLLALGVSSPREPFPEVTISGVSVEGGPLIAPRELQFGTSSDTCGALDRTVTVYNTTGAPLTLDRVAIEPPDDGAFVLPAPLERPLVLPPGAAYTFRVGFRATVPSWRAGAVRVESPSGTWLVALEGRAAPVARQVDRFEQLDSAPVDLLMVLDSSGCQGEEQQALAANLDVLLEGAVARRIDYQIAVTTTDIEGGEDGRLLPLTGDAALRRITPRTLPSPAAVLADRIRGVGVIGSANEQGLQAAYMALSSPLAFAHNADFLRPEAALAVMVMSDEDDYSPITVDFVADFLRSIKGAHHRYGATFSAIVGDPRGGCRGPGGAADGGDRYGAVTEASGGAFVSICATDWTEVARTLGAAAFGGRSRWRLTSAPVPGTLAVTVDGVALPDVGATGQVHWEYDDASQSVRFVPFSTPPPGAQVEVAYDVLCR